MRFANNAIASLALLSGVAIAHPGHNVAEEAAERRDFLQSVKRASLAHCADKLKARGVEARNVARRSAQLEKARQKRGLKKRDLDSVLATSHNQTDQGYTVNTDAATLFSGINSCVLTPEVTQGPYYVAGEYVRENIVEDQGGLDIVLDYQVIDVDTCEPIPDVYLEMWHCNSTGVYSGIVSSGNGDSSDETNIDNTWLRGIQLTDDDGVAQFESVFPGHYTSRATHIHIMIHTNATLLANQTLGMDNYASHVGQAFFDQDLITEVELLAPYNTNTQELTTNAEDSILSEEVATEGVDPVMEYTLLGDSVSDGLFAWLAFGINSTLSQSITPAAYLYAEGGVANSNSGGGMGGGSGGPSGTPGSGPSGTPGSGASGSAPTGAAPSGFTSSVSTSAASTTTKSSKCKA
ncbi:Intradiol ring-cleavage dioxygenase [Ilyonectria robusta]|uniref:Intradiol ring-cleavage dioxygenase n=1 Tax=Ilyonectria robusta TaxID=1079257 RepID=UPI001E8D6166|nr:Intradiol ring-cleavage dioxygenase [Ilyonectria robusta]KAH8685352.1 Intradiol ring-cleavage dioxygenase [Ilyonectria robusta]